MGKKSQHPEPDWLERVLIADLKKIWNTQHLRTQGLVFFIILDFLLGTLVFGPLIFVAFRGCWQVWDYLVVSTCGCGMTQSVGTAFLGSLFIFLLSLFHHYLRDWVKPDITGPWYSKKHLKFLFVSRGFVLVSVSCDTLMWKGVYDVLDQVVWLHRWNTNFLVFLYLAFFLISMESLNICHCTPIGKGFCFDINKDYLTVNTAFLLDRDSKPFWVHVVDALTTVFLNLVTIVVYHCLWVIMDEIKDHVLMRSRHMDSNIFLFCANLSLSGFILQFPNLLIHYKRIDPMFKFISHEVILMLTLIADVAMFHTAWDLLDDAILTETVSDEVSLLRKMRITGGGPEQDQVEDYELERLHLPANMTITQNCQELEKRLAKTFYWELVCFLSAYLIMVMLRISSTLLSGVKREAHRCKNGVLIPRWIPSLSLFSLLNVF